MRGTSRAVLAREAASQLNNGACKGKGSLWSETEAAIVRASTQSQRDAAAPALEICAGCPIVEQCAIWAKTDSYTGLAAGMYWFNGRAQHVDEVLPGPRQAAS